MNQYFYFQNKSGPTRAATLLHLLNNINQVLLQCAEVAGLASLPL